jgi:hypothetical protein
VLRIFVQQVETRQRQLDSLRKIEERYKNMTAGQAAANNHQGAAALQGAAAVRPEKLQLAAAQAGELATATLNPSKCSCHRLAMYVLDISRAMLDEHEVEWQQFRSNASLAAPEETILYTLVSGRSELIMFGGIQVLRRLIKLSI